MKIEIIEQGEWILIEIKSSRLIEKTRYSEFPQFVFGLDLEDGRTHTLWTPTRISTRSKKFSFLKAAIDNQFLKTGDKVDPSDLIGRQLFGLWGEEKGPEGKSIETFLRFLPIPRQKQKNLTGYM